MCSFAYSWNKAGGLKTYRLPSNRLVTYAPDAAGRTATVVSGSTTYASLQTGADPANGAAGLAGYAAHGGMQRLALGNGLIERTGYNNRLQPVSIQLGQVGSPQSVSGLGIFYCANLQSNCNDNNGSVQSQTISPAGVTETYNYDRL
ncbi:MAG TPA: hypothetical protein VNH18_19275, partial [Bryobacteraceae bacterium]|nr:hypothetical protein [Bryobacteraceae bacterium]